MHKLVDDLKAAKALIDTPERWTKGRWADDGETCFCAWGATKKARAGQACIDALVAAIPLGFQTRNLGTGRLISFNDDPSTTHADIIGLFDRAIAAAESTSP